MSDRIKNVHVEHKTKDRKFPVDRFAVENVKVINEFHKSFPEYEVTPLADLKNLASSLGVNRICVKDESYRFGLNAFKALGGSYAIGKYIAKTLGMDICELPYEEMVSEEIREKLGETTFITATDGNHGRGVAWTANRLKQNSVVYMPRGSAAERLENIQKLGSDASITDLSYDDAVRKASEDAKNNNWVLIQDTSWDGYEEIPGWIMEGYATMAYETMGQMQEKPTHIFLQAGVGAMSGAIAGFYAQAYGPDRPIITIVEPDKADCFYRTVKANDGEMHFVIEEMDTIMAGLACGEPCSIAWNILRDYADNFISMPDYVAAKGMRVLGNPLPGDQKVVSGESGAATLGLVAEVLQNKELEWLKTELKLDENSKILCISTEGDTDKGNYRRIVWDGWYAK